MAMEEEKKASKLKWITYWMCGIESSLTKNKVKQPKYVIDTSIYQSKFWSNVCDANAVIAMALCGFCYAFFNKFTDQFTDLFAEFSLKDILELEIFSIDYFCD